MMALAAPPPPKPARAERRSGPFLTCELVTHPEWIHNIRLISYIRVFIVSVFCDTKRGNDSRSILQHKCEEQIILATTSPSSSSSSKKEKENLRVVRMRQVPFQLRDHIYCLIITAFTFHSCLQSWAGGNIRVVNPTGGPDGRPWVQREQLAVAIEGSVAKWERLRSGGRATRCQTEDVRS